MNIGLDITRLSLDFIIHLRATSAKRNHYHYELKNGKKIFYIDITKDPERRKEEHEREGKNFNSMDIIGP